MAKWWRVGRIVLHILTAIGFGCLFIFAKTEYQSKPCKNVLQKIDRFQDNAFLDEHQIMTALYEIEPTGFVGVEKSSVNLAHVEHQMEQKRYVESAEVYFDKESNLVVQVQERHPILRIINMHGVSYYLDNGGKRMPFSDKFTSRVVVATGKIQDTPAQDKELYKLISAIASEPKLASVVQQIYLSEEGDYQMVSLFGSHSIVLGDLSDLEDKLLRLVAFYESSTGKVDLSKYRQVVLKYRNQIVCKKF